MHDLYITQNTLDMATLDTDMRAQFGDRISGLSYNGAELRVHFLEQYTTDDETAAQALVDAHDPVFITAEREDDNVTVTLTKPRNLDGATELTLTIDDTAAPEATSLTGNSATVLIESVDAIAIGILEDYPHTEVTI